MASSFVVEVQLLVRALQLIYHNLVLLLRLVILLVELHEFRLPLGVQLHLQLQPAVLLN